MVLKFSHLDLVNVTYPISRTRWNLSFNFCVIVQLVKTGPLVVHGSQVLALRLNVHWIKGFDIFLHGKHNVIICTKTKRFFFSLFIPSVLLKSHISGWALTFDTVFNVNFEKHISCSQEIWFCVFLHPEKTIRSCNLSIERQNWLSFTASKV